MQERKKTQAILYRFLPQTGSSPVPLALPRRVSLKCNIKLQVAQTHKYETSFAQSHKKETSNAQAHKKETSNAQAHKQETLQQLQRIEKNFEYLIYYQRYSQYKTKQNILCFLRYLEILKM